MRQPFVDMPLETVEEIMRTNFLGAVYLRARSVAVHDRQRRRAHRQYLFPAQEKIGTPQHGGLLRLQVSR